MSQSLKTQWALITGATSGIGLACAEGLAAQGANLILTGRRADRLNHLQRTLRSQYPDQSFESFAFDVSDRADVEKSLSTAGPLIEKVTILINNAGLARGTEPLQKGEINDWEEMIDTNIKGLLYMTRKILPQMLLRRTGDIVNIGSVAGRWTYPGGGVYCATKFAVRALSESLRLDIQGSGVRVINIEPGMVETEFSEVRFRDSEKAKAVYANTTPLIAKDIADSVLWCLMAPRRVNVQEMVIFPTDQAAVGHVYRR